MTVYAISVSVAEGLLIVTVNWPLSVGSDAASLAAIVISAESLSAMVPVATSVIVTEPTGTIAVTVPLRLTLKLSDASTKESSLSGTTKSCVSPAVPKKLSVWEVEVKSAVPAVPVVKSTLTLNPPSTALDEVAVKVIVPSSVTVTSAIVTTVASLSVIESVPVSAVSTSRPFSGVVSLTARAILNDSVVASTKSSSVIAMVKVFSPVSPAFQVTLWVAPAKSLPSPPKLTSMVKSWSTSLSRFTVIVAVPADSLTVTSATVTTAASLSMIVPVAVSAMTIEATGTVADTAPLMLTLKLSAVSTSVSSVTATVKSCVSPGVPVKASVCERVAKSAVPAVPVAKFTSTLNPFSTALEEVAVKVIVPSSETVTSSIVTVVESLSTIESVPVSAVATARPLRGVVLLTAKEMPKFSVAASTKSSSLIATVNVLSPVSPADQVTLCVLFAKSLPSPPKLTSTVRSWSRSLSRLTVIVAVPAASSTVTSATVTAAASSSVMFPMAVSEISMDPTGTVAVTLLMLTVKLSAASTSVSLFNATLKVCVSPADPLKLSVWVVVVKSAAVAVAGVKSTSTLNPPSMALVDVAVKVIVPSSATVTSSIVMTVESLSIIDSVPTSLVVTSRPASGVVALTASAILNCSMDGSTNSSSLIAIVNDLSPVSPAVHVTFWVAFAKSLPSPPKLTSTVKSWSRLLSRFTVIVAVPASSLTVTSATVTTAASLSMIVPVAVSEMSIDPTGTVAVTLLMLTLKFSAASISVSSFTETLKLCVSPAVPLKISV